MILKEAKDKIAIKYQFSNWEMMELRYRPFNNQTDLIVRLDEAAELYMMSNLKLAFDAGLKCNQEHPDDDSYDKVHFERVLELLKP